MYCTEWSSLNQRPSTDKPFFVEEELSGTFCAMPPIQTDKCVQSVWFTPHLGHFFQHMALFLSQMLSIFWLQFLKNGVSIPLKLIYWTFCFENTVANNIETANEVLRQFNSC